MALDVVIVDVVWVDVEKKGARRKTITMAAVALDRSGTVGRVGNHVEQIRP
jgi:hypothetical protein